MPSVCPEKRDKVMFTFETGMLCWFEENFFHFFICQKQFEYLMWWNIPFKRRRCFFPIVNCFWRSISFFFHVVNLRFSWNGKHRGISMKLKKVERGKGNTTISWVKNMNQWYFYVWKYHKNNDTQHALLAYTIGFIIGDLELKNV